MENQALQEQMFRTMFRLRRFYPGDIFEDISMGELGPRDFGPGAGM